MANHPGLKTSSSSPSTLRSWPCLEPQPDEDRHPILEGEEPADYRFTRVRGPRTAYDPWHREPEWRPSIKMREPISLSAAGMTTAQRRAAEERHVRQRAPVPDKPRDDAQRERTSHRPFTAHSHLLHSVDLRDPISKLRETSEAPLVESDVFGRPAHSSTPGEGRGGPGGSTNEWHRPYKARVPDAQGANVGRPASANPNALILDRPEAKSFTSKKPGSCRPAPDSLTLEAGTAVVGAVWGAAEPDTWQPGNPIRPDSARSEKSLAPRPNYHNNHTPWGHVESAPRGVDHGYADADGGRGGEQTGGERPLDTRVRERMEYEVTLRSAAEERRASEAEYAANKAKISGASNILGDYMYEVRGNYNTGRNGGKGRGPHEGRPHTAGPPGSRGAPTTVKWNKEEPFMGMITRNQ